MISHQFGNLHCKVNVWIGEAIGVDNALGLTKIMVLE